MIDEFDAAKPDWLELWQGPLNFRATYDKGQYGPGSTLERINQYGREGATGNGRHLPIYSVKLAADDGAIVIEWLDKLPHMQPPLTTVRYYRAGLGRGLYERLSSDEQLRNNQLPFLATDQRQRALGAFACGLTMRDWAEREFFHALHARQCKIWARVGSKVAPYRSIPADVFAAYEIQTWGEGNHGGAWAKLEGAEPLFAIKVAATQDDDKTALDELLSILQSQASHIWERARDPINSEFFRATRGQSDSHINALTAASEKVTSELLERAFKVATPFIDDAQLRQFAATVFEPMAAEICEIAVGKSGRSPQPENAETAESCAAEAWRRVESLIKLWRVEANELRPFHPSNIAALEVTETARAPAFKRGRPPSNDDILAKADQLKARGLNGYEIASKMRLEPGFENVATTAIRDLIKGRYRGGRPSAKAP